MKRKIGILINCLPLGVILILLEYYGVLSPFFPTSGYLSFVLSMPIITILLIRNRRERGLYCLLFLSYVVSVVLGLILLFLIGSPPSYWTKPFTPSGLALFFSTFNLMTQLLILFMINLGRGFIDILKPR